MAAQQQQQPDQSTSLDVMWGAVALVAIALLIWYFGKDYIIQTILYIKITEVHLLSYFTDKLIGINETMQFYTTVPDAVSVDQINQWLYEVGSYLRVPIMILLGLLALYLVFVHPSLKFNTRFTMKHLGRLEQENWPQITPVIREDIINVGLNEGKWAMALSPMEFAKKHHLLKVSESKSRYSARKDENLIATVLEEKAHNVFAAQMGPLWEGIDKCPAHIKALFAAFAAKGLHHPQEAYKLLQTIARSTKTGKISFVGTDALLKKYKNDKRVQRVTKKHAYLLTVMSGMLEFCRGDGVFATADFIWLKPIDRPLYYMLNCVGRQTPFCEVAGPIAHYLAEAEIGRKITQPMIYEATKGLEQAISSQIYTKDDEDIL